MKYQKLIIILFGFAVISVIIGSLTHFFSSSDRQRIDVSKLLANAPNSKELIAFANSLKEGNSQDLKGSLGRLGGKNTEEFMQAFSRGFISDIWGMKRVDGVDRLALGAQVEYDKTFSIQQHGNALFVFYLKGNEWQLDYFFPGAMLLPSKR